jgi:5-methylcytosine-specific restriction endonuclease McrA
MPKPTPATIKRLFAVSGNRCAFPECNTPLSENTDTVTGQICHICADSKGGPRGTITDQSDEDRRAYANLILLCPRHHAIVDAETDRYTVEVLLGIQAAAHD